jgi:cytidyltransferase-like protein
MNRDGKNVVICGGFDEICSSDIRFLQEASKFGLLYVLLWSDELIKSKTGRNPEFPLNERLYFLQAVRYVHKVCIVKSFEEMFSLDKNLNIRTWIVRQGEDNPAIRTFCKTAKTEYLILEKAALKDFPDSGMVKPGNPSRKKVLVTGCFDWFHSGHVCFFEEVSQLGNLYVVVGSDNNVKALKGQGHPMFSQDERRYMTASIRYVTQALISTGQGWLDAEPELKMLKPEIYAVNEDGDRPEKRNYCQQNGIKYIVLKRLPKEDLPKRQSTKMRGF